MYNTSPSQKLVPKKPFENDKNPKENDGKQGQKLLPHNFETKSRMSNNTDFFSSPNIIVPNGGSSTYRVVADDKSRLLSQLGLRPITRL
jgi:hypothetical protein